MINIKDVINERYNKCVDDINNEISTLTARIYYLESIVGHYDVVIYINYYRGVGGSTKNSLFRHLNLGIVVGEKFFTCYEKYDFSYEEVYNIVNEVDVERFYFRKGCGYEFNDLDEFLNYCRVICSNDSGEYVVPPKH